MLTTLEDLRRDGTPAQAFLDPDPLTDWNRFRHIGAVSKKRIDPAKLRKLLLALGITMLLVGVGVVIHFRMPSLVSFAKEVRATVNATAASFASRPAVRSARRIADLEASSSQTRTRRVRFLHEGDESYRRYLRVPGPFEAVAIIGDRRIRMVPAGGIVLIDVESGTWTTAVAQ
jgi:hypothetical protein